MENKKNEVGNIYGSRISKNGKWLNLIIAAKIKGEEVFITCPVRLIDGKDDKKPFAHVQMACTSEGNRYPEGKALICNLPVYEDNKKDESPKEFADDTPL